MIIIYPNKFLKEFDGCREYICNQCKSNTKVNYNKDNDIQIILDEVDEEYANESTKK